MFVQLVLDFVAEHDPASHHRGPWRTLLHRGDLGQPTEAPSVVAAVDASTSNPVVSDPVVPNAAVSDAS